MRNELRHISMERCAWQAVAHLKDAHGGLPEGPPCRVRDHVVDDELVAYARREAAYARPGGAVHAHRARPDDDRAADAAHRACAAPHVAAAAPRVRPSVAPPVYDARALCSQVGTM